MYIDHLQTVLEQFSKLILMVAKERVKLIMDGESPNQIGAMPYYVHVEITPDFAPSVFLTTVLSRYKLCCANVFA